MSYVAAWQTIGQSRLYTIYIGMENLLKKIFLKINFPYRGSRHTENKPTDHINIQNKIRPSSSNSRWKKNNVLMNVADGQADRLTFRIIFLPGRDTSFFSIRTFIIRRRTCTIIL